MIGHACGQAEFPLAYPSRMEHFSIQEVEAVASWEGRVAFSCHLGCIFTYIVCHIRHVRSLLQHHVASAQIVGKEVHL